MTNFGKLEEMMSDNIIKQTGAELCKVLPQFKRMPIVVTNCQTMEAIQALEVLPSNGK